MHQTRAILTLVIGRLQISGRFLSRKTALHKIFRSTVTGEFLQQKEDNETRIPQMVFHRPRARHGAPRLRHAGLPALVFPSSCGSFFEFEDRGMVNVVHEKLEHGRLQLFCVDSVDAESWYNLAVPARWRIARHMQYEQYLMQEVLPLIHHQNQSSQLAAIGCSFGGFHALNIALRHPDVFTAMLSMSGAFDTSSFLSGYYDDDCLLQHPHALSAEHQRSLVSPPLPAQQVRLATGVHDQMLELKRNAWPRSSATKNLPCQLDVWGDDTGHDWPWWQRMLQTYL